ILIALLQCGPLRETLAAKAHHPWALIDAIAGVTILAAALTLIYRPALLFLWMKDIRLFADPTAIYGIRVRHWGQELAIWSLASRAYLWSCALVLLLGSIDLLRHLPRGSSRVAGAARASLPVVAVDVLMNTVVLAF